MTQVPYTFGTESSPIPLSQLDANFAVTPQFATTAGNVVNPIQANITSIGTLSSLSVTGNVNAGNVRTTGSFSSFGNIASGNVNTGGLVSAFGNVTGGQFITNGNAVAGNLNTIGVVTATGNVTGGNISTAGQISAQGNISSQGIISATGNIVTDATFIGNFQGNITGNLSVGGSNTQVLFNSNGNVGAAGGLTYDSGANTLGILGVVSAQGNIFGGNLTVAGITQLSGTATAPTALTGTANNQVATTAFVNNQLNQYANNVAITGGNISANNITANTVAVTNWTIKQISNTLYFQFNGSNVAKLDSSGNFTTIGNVTGFGTV
jgi:hypothetical protein